MNESKLKETLAAHIPQIIETIVAQLPQLIDTIAVELPSVIEKAVQEQEEKSTKRLKKESADKERAYTEEYVLRKELQSELKNAKVDAIKEFVARLDKKAMYGKTCSGCVEVVEWCDVVEVMEEMVGEES